MQRARPWSKLEKRAVGLATVAAACLIGVGLFKNYLDRDPVIHFPTPIPRPKPNGYDIYLAASKAIVRTLPACDEEFDAGPKRGLPLDLR